MAEGLLARALPELRIRSAGLGALIGHRADETAIHLMAERQIDISSHIATQVTRELCLAAELVLVMDHTQRRRVEDLYPQALGRVYRIGEFTRQDIPDPYRQHQSTFRLVLSMLEASIDLWLPRIQKISRVRS
ncbi:low molecular weight phosphotyrosine protein phosphatase [Ramlibacter tataouinensis]|uniref:arsenate reductase/protein-tyrosine-phosphatase family protein n=1 Tax=Ramlibacter tataouinensis TaxID=94132 RepID=UPI0022F39A1F|nr:low molecular weight phosphotyrosine protein phosphatase [Ramlibacter tataouinensis]WBY02074.1 low molecular weight phosphotyrosine protein phosphatase [Ramlibacter tataouinensis]